MINHGRLIDSHTSQILIYYYYYDYYLLLLDIDLDTK